MHDFRNLNAPSCDYGENTGPLGGCRHKVGHEQMKKRSVSNGAILQSEMYIFQGLDGKNGKLKLVIIGNSWAANHARIIYDECGKKAKSIVQFSLTDEHENSIYF